MSTTKDDKQTRLEIEIFSKSNTSSQGNQRNQNSAVHNGLHLLAELAGTLLSLQHVTSASDQVE